MIQRVREIELKRKWLRAALINNFPNNGLSFSENKTIIVIRARDAKIREILNDDFVRPGTCLY